MKRTQEIEDQSNFNALAIFLSEKNVEWRLGKWIHVYVLVVSSEFLKIYLLCNQMKKYTY